MSAAVSNQRYPIRRAILVGLGGIVTAGLLMLAASTLVQITATSANSAAAWRSYQLLDSIRELQVAEEETRAAVLAAVASPSVETLAAVTAHETAMAASLRSILAQVATDVKMTDALEAAVTSTSSWYESWARPIHDGLVAADARSSEAALNLGQGDQLFAITQRDTDALRSAAAGRLSATLGSFEDQARLLSLGVGIAGIALCLGTLSIGRWIIRVVTRPLQHLNETAFAQLNGEPVQFVAERNDEVGALAVVLERLRLMVDERYADARAESRLAATMNKLSDLIAFSSAESEVIDGTVRALRRLVTTRRGDVQLANASRNRLLYAGSWGSEPPGLDTPVPVDRIDRCPAIRRAAPFVVPDVGDDLAVLCAAHPQESGSLACIPLIAMGQPIGVIHLESDGPITDETVSIAMRIAEQVAVAIANARLITTMEGLAMTDGLTGLRNARFFDTYLEQELAAAERDHEPMSILMIDLDHFKKFNDTYGHPAGDEALRVFGRVVRATLRSSDLPARYGGEEFVVALRHTDLEGAALVAEKLRDAVARAIVEIGPGRYGRLSVSIGVAESDPTRIDQKALLSSADAALYRAKSGGRNRVVLSSQHDHDATGDETESMTGRSMATGPNVADTAVAPVLLAARRRRRGDSTQVAPAAAKARR